MLDPVLHHKIKVIAALKRESLSEAIERYLMEAVPTLEEALTSSAIVVSAYKDRKVCAEQERASVKELA